METIHFGTDGWRGVIAENFTYENVRRVAKSLVLLINEKKWENPVVIGYDFRFMSEYFARTIHDELMEAGIKSELSDQPIPTPALSYAAKKRKAAFGVMITASHNPHFYNGIKFKASWGGPVMPDFTSDVTRLLKKVKSASNKSPVYSDKTKCRDFLSPYKKALKKYVNFSLLENCGIKVAVDSMFATGGNLFRDILCDTDIKVSSVRCERNPLFDMQLPEPVLEFLEPLLKLIKNNKCDIGLATDGDADRIGVLDSNGDFVTLHYIMPLLYEYLTESRGMKGNAVRTTSADDIFDYVCEDHGRKCIEVPVGFKNVCEVVLEDDILVGGEESGGVCFKKHIPERDGILTGLLLLEMMAAKKMNIADLVKDMSKRYHPVAYLRTDKIYDQKKLKENLKNLKASPPKKIAGSKLKRADKKDGIKFYMENGCWMLMRVSDTEPKGRIYTGGPKLEDVKKTLKAGEKLLFS